MRRSSAAGSWPATTTTTTTGDDDHVFSVGQLSLPELWQTKRGRTGGGTVEHDNNLDHHDGQHYDHNNQGANIDTIATSADCCYYNNHNNYYHYHYGETDDVSDHKGHDNNNTSQSSFSLLPG